jgi:transcriptional regulator with XRE-family HTH domain
MPKPTPTLRTIIEEIGLTQKELGALIGVSSTTVWRWYEGEAYPRPARKKQLMALAKAYGVSEKMSTALLAF